MPSPDPLLTPAWELIRTVELRPFLVGPEGMETELHYRVEVWKSLMEASSYSVRLRRADVFRLTRTFPQEPDQFEPLHHTDEILWVEDTEIQDFDFAMPTADDAMEEALHRIREYWARRTG
jgi:hypothetical protein